MMLGGCGPRIDDRDIEFASLGEVKASLDSERVILIDARAREDYDAGHLPGAIWIGLDEVTQERSKDDPRLAGRRPLVYGDSPGDAAARAMVKKLMAAGYGSARLFAGGVAEWSVSNTLESD